MSEDIQEHGVPDPIDDPVTEIRVITEEDAKLYRARVLLAYLESETFDLEQVTIEVDTPVPVISDDGTRLGFASVFFDGSRMLADVAIDYATGERLLAETQAVKLYPRIYGGTTIAMAPMLDLQEKVTLKRLRVSGIVLSTKRPTDDRIVSFGSMVF